MSVASDAIAAAGGLVVDRHPLDRPMAVDIWLHDLAPPAARAALEQALPHIDVIVQPAGPDRAKRLLIADMDSTMIEQECIDELADYAGRKAEIAVITERAMQGELDFAAALRARVAALAGLGVDAIDRCLAERIVLTPGGRTLVATMRARRARTLLVSGGFTAFTGPIAGRLGFDRQVANHLDMADGRLTGSVAEPIVDSSAKRQTLIAERYALALPRAATLAVGDGANDIPMLQEAGLGIAFHAKPKAAAAADTHVRHGDLTVLLHAQGIPRADWVAVSDR